MMKFELGLYEQLITKLIANKLQSIDEDKFFVKSSRLDKEEAWLARAARALFSSLFELLYLL